MIISFQNNKAFYMIAICLLMYFFLTQIIVDPLIYQETGFQLTNNYFAISNCVSFPNCKYLGEDYGQHQLQRWLPNVLVGIFSELTSIDLKNSYLFFQIGIILYFTYLSSIIRVDVPVKIIIFSSVLFFPYGFRLFFYAPAMLVDSVFFLSCFMFAVSVINKKNGLFFTALIFASFSRQTSILLIFLIFVFYMYGKINIKESFWGSLLLLILFLLNNYLALLFFEANSSSLLKHITGIFMHVSFDNLIGFVSRGLLFFVLLTPFVLFRIKRNYVIMFLFSVSILASQPILAGPGITGENIIRLMAYSVAFSPILFMRKKIKTFSFITFVFVLLSMINSLHHNYSILTSQKMYLVVILFSFFVSIIFILIIKLNNYTLEH